MRQNALLKKSQDEFIYKQKQVSPHGDGFLSVAGSICSLATLNCTPENRVRYPATLL